MTLPLSPLVSEEMLDLLRAVAYPGLQTEVSILRRQPVDDNPYGDDTESWVEMTSTFGWIRQMNDPAINDQLGIAQTIGIFRLELPVGTELEIGDMVGVEGKTYTVQNTSKEDTLQVFLEAYLRVVE